MTVRLRDECRNDDDATDHLVNESMAVDTCYLGCYLGLGTSVGCRKYGRYLGALRTTYAAAVCTCILSPSNNECRIPPIVKHGAATGHFEPIGVIRST